MAIRRSVLACVLAALPVLSVPDVAEAAMVVFDTPATADPVMVGGVPHLSYNFDIILAMGETLVAFDALFTSDTMSHDDAIIPLNSGGEWNSLNAVIDESIDSQFHFGSAFWDQQTTGGDFPPEAPESKTPGVLGIIAADPDAAVTGTFTLAHVVIPAMASGKYRIGLGISNDADPDLDVELDFPGGNAFGDFGVVPIPEASQVLAGTFLTFGLVGTYLVRRRLSNRSVST
jgi:hypothetical protein